MRKYMIKQAIIIPILFFVPVFIWGFLINNYYLIEHHASEITLTDFDIAKTLINSGAILTGLSCVVMAIVIILNFKKFIMTSILLLIFGISMISNGLYPMGTIMHGFSILCLFTILVV